MKQYKDSRYWVNEDGKVFRFYKKRYSVYAIHKGVKTTYPAKPKRWNELKSHEMKHGYWFVTIHQNGKPKTLYVHQMVAGIYVPGYFEEAHVDHIDCNKHNNHYTNLQWCTKEYNSKKGNNPNYPLFAHIE